MKPLLCPGDKVVLTTIGSYGDLFPYLNIGQALRQRGIEVVVATTDIYQAEVIARGLRFAPLSPSADDVRTDLGEELPALMRRATSKFSGPKFAVTQVVLPYLQRNIAELEAACAGAKLLISHPYSFAAPLVAERSGIGWRSVLLQPLLLMSPYDPAVLSEFLPLHRLQPLLGPRLYGKVLALAKAATRRWSRPVDEMRRQMGLRPAPGNPLFDGAVSPQGGFALFDPVLLADERGLPPNIQVVGFSHSDGGAGLPVELLNFLAANTAPLVFTLGTSAVHNPGRFYEYASTAAAALKRPAVFLTGEYAFKHRLPANQIAVCWASHAELFPRAAVVVHQGGMGTCFQALRAGVPQLVVPFGNDQPDNANRLKRLGVALTMNSWFSTARKMTQRLERLLTDHSFRQSAQQVQDSLLPQDGAQRIADVLTCA